MSNLASGGGSLHPPLHAGDTTSPWFALQYVEHYRKQYTLDTISAHDLVRLVASIGAETNGHYTYQSIQNATQNYFDHRRFPSVGTSWIGYVGHVTQAAKHHGHKGWVSGFSYSSKDVPGSGGPSTVQKIADGPVGDAAVAVGHGVKSVGGLIPGISKDVLLLLVVVVVVVLIARK